MLGRGSSDGGFAATRCPLSGPDYPLCICPGVVPDDPCVAGLYLGVFWSVAALDLFPSCARAACWIRGVIGLLVSSSIPLVRTWYLVHTQDDGSDLRWLIGFTWQSTFRTMKSEEWTRIRSRQNNDQCNPQRLVEDVNVQYPFRTAYVRISRPRHSPVYQNPTPSGRNRKRPPEPIKQLYKGTEHPSSGPYCSTVGRYLRHTAALAGVGKSSWISERPSTTQLIFGVGENSAPPGH